MSRRALAGAVALLLLAVGAHAAAERVVSPKEFEQLSEGNTLYFTLQGEPYGAERYFPDRRVRWRFASGLCEEGHWYPSGDQICFVYEGSLQPVCWNFLERGGSYLARIAGATSGDGDLLLVGQDQAPLECPGPDTGV
ncbi:MAG: hypothetical protein AAGE18_14180 [Pseudomonadota bacterium]